MVAAHAAGVQAEVQQRASVYLDSSLSDPLVREALLEPCHESTRRCSVCYNNMAPTRACSSCRRGAKDMHRLR